MASKVKGLYNVYARRWTFYEYDAADVDEWRLIGQTRAVSEAKAVNNMRYRHPPNDYQGHDWEESTEFKAIETYKDKGELLHENEE